MIQGVITMPQVKIRIEKGVQTAGDGQEQQESFSKTYQKIKGAAPTAFALTMVNTGKQIITYSLSNVGQFTGNYLQQDEINRELEIIGDVVSIAGSLVYSAVTQNPIPLIASVVSVGVKYGTKAYSEYQEMKHAQYATNLLVQRSGNSTTNGSRGTEN